MWLVLRCLILSWIIKLTCVAHFTVKKVCRSQNCRDSSNCLGDMKCSAKKKCECPPNRAQFSYIQNECKHCPVGAYFSEKFNACLSCKAEANTYWHNGKCYRVVNSKMNWYNAHTHCKSLDSILIVIENERQLNTLSQIKHNGSFWVSFWCE